MSSVLLAEETQGRRFDSSEEQLMTDTLQAVEDATITMPLEDPRQLLLNGEFRTLDGDCRLTWLAIRQVCRVLAAGLGTYIADLTGHRRAPSQEDEEFYSHQDAADVINSIVRRRFNRGLMGMQAIRNSQTNLIESVVGRGYQRMPNRDFLERVKEVLGEIREPLVFHEAVVVGRRLRLVYRYDVPVYQSEDDRAQAAYPGFCFVNSEVGDGAVRATPVIWIDPSGLALMPYNKSSRVAHTGRDFNRRMHRLLDRTIDRWRNDPIAQPGAGLSASIAAMQAHSLQFTGTNEEADDLRYNELIRIVRREQTTLAVARRVMRRTLFAGGRDEAPIDQQQSERRRTWSMRSSFDLFVSFLRETQDNFLNISGRERLEQIAYQMLSGRFRPEQAQPRTNDVATNSF